MSTLDLYDLAVGPRDPHQGPDRGLGWPGDSRWDPPTSLDLDPDFLVDPGRIVATDDPPAGYRWSATNPPGQTRTVHLVALADLDRPRVDGRSALCGVWDHFDVPDPAGRTVCPDCWHQATTHHQEDQ